MILRKPYGFLIKHYKIINFILLIPMFYIALKFGDIASFFRDYISNATLHAHNMGESIWETRAEPG